MEQLVTFIGTNWILVTALIVILLLLGNSFLGGRFRGYKSTSPSEAVKMINHDDAVMLDVREDSEYQKGHIINCVHVPMSYLSDRLKELDKFKDKPVIVGCRSGHRSAQACAMLKKQGFENVYNLSGGVMAWQNANLPLVKD